MFIIALIKNHVPIAADCVFVTEESANKYCLECKRKFPDGDYKIFKLWSEPVPLDYMMKNDDEKDDE